MDYKGRYKILDPQKINTYPLAGRNNKVKLNDLIETESLDKVEMNVSDETEERIHFLAREIISARENNRPVVLFTGAHLIKNGLSKLIGDLVDRRPIYHYLWKCSHFYP